MILPTLLVAIDITRRARRDAAEFWHNLAMCAWICANAVWMTGEFFFNDSWRTGSPGVFRGRVISAGVALPAAGISKGCGAVGKVGSRLILSQEMREFELSRRHHSFTG
jgi:hypothetical protein